MQPSPDSTRGYTMAEILAVLTIFGILVALAAPSMNGMIARWRVDSALEQLRSDLHYARMLAVSSGNPVEVRFTPTQSNTCLDGYEIVAAGDNERRLKSLNVSQEFRGVCVSQSGGAEIRFGSRGVPRSLDSRLVRATQAAIRDSLVFSAAGRVHRFR